MNVNEATVRKEAAVLCKKTKNIFYPLLSSNFKPSIFKSTAQQLHLVAPAEGYSDILAIRVCATGKGMVFQPFSLV